jgi:DNA-binding transcriptional LysR family regulator
VADLNDIAVFVRVAQFESFSRAAHALGMPVSTVSRKVTALEERLGVTLLQRTTRKLSLTAQGRAYYNQCSELLSQLFDAERVLTQTQKKPEGLLRISAPVILGQEAFYAFLSSFLKTYPGSHRSPPAPYMICTWCGLPAIARRSQSRHARASS